MKLTRPNIPNEVDADVAISVITSCVESNIGDKASYSYDFTGVSERTALGDVVSVDIKNKQNKEATIKFSLKRDSIYHILPEFLFHPLDRFLGAEGDVAEFEKRYKEQEEQKQNALSYFRPFDEQFQILRTHHQHWLNENIFNGNRYLADYIISGYQINIQNPYILAVLPCVVWLRANRGNDDMVRTAIGYAFSGKVQIEKERQSTEMMLSTNVHSSLDETIDDLFLGDTSHSVSYVWRVKYQTELESEQTLVIIKQHIEEFERFFTEWFLSVEESLCVEFGDWEAKPLVSANDSKSGIFLNYSTQLI